MEWPPRVHLTSLAPIPPQQLVSSAEVTFIEGLLWGLRLSLEYFIHPYVRLTSSHEIVRMIIISKQNRLWEWHSKAISYSRLTQATGCLHTPCTSQMDILQRREIQLRKLILIMSWSLSDAFFTEELLLFTDITGMKMESIYTAHTHTINKSSLCIYGVELHRNSCDLKTKTFKEIK